MTISYGVKRTPCWPCCWYGGRLFDGEPADNATCHYSRTEKEAARAAEAARDGGE